MTADASEQAALLELMNATIHQSIPIAEKMQVRVCEVAPGRVVGEVDAAGNSNHIGTMYAGVLFTLAEIVGGPLAMVTFDAERFYPVVKDLRIRFLRPARGTVRATAELTAEEIVATRERADADGKADFTVTTSLVDAEGTEVATTEGIYQIRRHGI